MRQLFILLVLFTMILAACSPKSNEQNVKNVTEQSWEDIVTDAKGTKVRMFMWGGDEGINQYMDEVIAPKLKEGYDIQFERVPMDTQDILQKLLTEKKAGKSEGTMDIIGSSP